MIESLGMPTFGFSAAAYAGERSQSRADRAKFDGGAQAAHAAIAAADSARTSDGVSAACAAMRDAYEQAAAAAREFRREPFASLAKTTDPDHRAAPIASIDDRRARRYLLVPPIEVLRRRIERTGRAKAKAGRAPAALDENPTFGLFIGPRGVQNPVDHGTVGGGHDDL